MRRKRSKKLPRLFGNFAKPKHSPVSEQPACRGGMTDLVLLRHGQSIWNRQDKFTGWVDVGLTEEGYEQASKAGEAMLTAGIKFDLAYTSYLRRATQTLWKVQETMDLCWIPVKTDWRLNERHYGGLTGRNKQQTREEFGEEQVRIWRRSYAASPPPGDGGVVAGRKYKGISVPAGESLRDTLERVVPCWEQKIVPDLRAGQNILVAAHGNSLRALVKHLDGMDEDRIMKFEIPTGMPLSYRLDDELRVLSRDFLG